MGGFESTIGFGYKTLTKVPVSEVTTTPTDGEWLIRYGKASMTTSTNGNSLKFSVLGDNNKRYVANYTLGGVLTTLSRVELSVSTTNQESITKLTILQPREYTNSRVAQFTWTIEVNNPVQENHITFFIYINPIVTGVTTRVITGATVLIAEPETVLVSTSRTALTTEPRITVSFLPIDDFQDIANVIFDIEDGKKHGCAESSPPKQYKQLIGNDGHQIHVLSPFISCYLVGEGYFAVDKMYSINKTEDAVWVEVTLYAMVKFILNRLMNCKFDMNILLRRNTKRFLRELAASEYANFLEYFELYSYNEKYFLE